MRRLLSWLKQIQFAHFSTPACNRPIYRAIRQSAPLKIVELGMADCERAIHMIDLAVLRSPRKRVEYTGIDLFEDQESSVQPKLTLKQAHQRLARRGCQVRLVPGDPLTALARVANSLGVCDLVIISADVNADSLSRAWLLLPRILHAETRSFAEPPGPANRADFARELSRGRIDALASGARARRAA